MNHGIFGQPSKIVQDGWVIVVILITPSCHITMITTTLLTSRLGELRASREKLGGAWGRGYHVLLRSIIIILWRSLPDATMAVTRYSREVLCLYKRLLKLHDRLPGDFATLGRRFVQEEFKRHKTASQEQAKMFIKEWTVSLSYQLVPHFLSFFDPLILKESCPVRTKTDSRVR